MIDNIERARRALDAIDPGCDRELWVKAGMAAKAAGLDVDAFKDWSRGAPNFKNDRDCDAVWRSIGDGAVTERTLFYLAREAGWRDDVPRPTLGGYRRRTDAPTPEAASNDDAVPTTPNADVLRIWNDCAPAPSDHPYIVAKGGAADGLRMVRTDSDLRVAGTSVAGWLAVPAVTLDGELQTVQFIPPPGVGKKLNAAGAGFGDGLHVVGGFAGDGPVMLVEGIGQAWACATNSGASAVVAFGAGRMARVAQLLRDQFPARQLVIVPDRGKEKQTAVIARNVGAFWVEFPEALPDNFDANDYAREFGGDALRTLLLSPRAPLNRFRLLQASEVERLPVMRWRVRGVLPESGLACIYGPSGSGKSFLAMDLCAAVADGRQWFGKRVARAPVVYMALEGEAGIRQRALAWKVKAGRSLPSRLWVVMTPMNLRTAADVDELAAAVRTSGCAGGVLVIDTLNRAASGADENSSSDMGEIIDAAKALQVAVGGVVLLVHHSGKDVSRGLRGHSSLHAALDSVIEVQRTAANQRSWRIAKSKDDSDEAAHGFRLEVVTVGTDDDGEPVTSCVVVPDGEAAPIRRYIPPKGGNQRVALDVLKQLARSVTRLPDGRAPMPLQTALDRVGVALPVDPKRRTERARTALDRLGRRGALVIEDGQIWLA